MKTMNTGPCPALSNNLYFRSDTSSTVFPGDPVLPDTAIFLRELTNCIRAHLHDPTLCLPKLLRLLGMSRSDLHRKLKAATGMSATEYIRYLRLRRAARLLTEQPERSVFCIAIEVGFNDHSYFTRRFREVYGVCPANFRTAQRNLEHTL
jgi:AraC-like DNA-binding protein